MLFLDVFQTFTTAASFTRIPPLEAGPPKRSLDWDWSERWRSSDHLATRARPCFSGLRWFGSYPDGSVQSLLCRLTREFSGLGEEVLNYLVKWASCKTSTELCSMANKYCVCRTKMSSGWFHREGRNVQRALDQLQPHQRGTFISDRNALALISRCAHFDTSKRVEKEEPGEKGKFHFYQKSWYQRQSKVHTYKGRGKTQGEDVHVYSLVYSHYVFIHHENFLVCSTYHANKCFWLWFRGVWGGLEFC